MPEGSLTININTLQGTLSGITDLLGQPPEGGDLGSGLAGTAGLASVSLGDQFGAFEAGFTGQVSNLFQFDATASLTELTDLFSGLQTEVQAPPTEALAGFEQRISEANTVFEGDFIQGLQQVFEAVQGISAGVPENRTEIVNALLDQILGILTSLEGPEAQRIQAWIQSIQDLNQVLLPLIEQAQTSPDPTAIVIEVFQRALNSTLEVFQFGPVNSLLDFLDELLGNGLSPELLGEMSAALTTSSLAYGQLLAGVGSDYPEFRDWVVVAAEELQVLKDGLRPVMGVINRITTARILQPQALERFLREQIEAALAVEIQAVQRIDNPFNELFDHIDETIDAVNLEVVRTEVLDFFETTRNTIEQVNIPSIGDTLQAQLGMVEQTVIALQQGVTDLLAQITDFFNSLTQRFEELANTVGTFQPDGTFQYRFEQDLRDLFNSAQAAIGGDPSNPDAPSVLSSLQDFQATLDQFLGQVEGLLQPVNAAISTVTTTAVDGINTFSAFLTGLNVTDLIDQLSQQIEQILDALGPIDFAVITDPVIAEIEETTINLQSIDTESLNALLREALKVALDVIISIDFTVSISTPLRDEFAAVRAIPQAALDELQQRYEQAIALLDTLGPDQLLAALFSAFDTISDALTAVSLETLLAPLDQLHQQFLQDPLYQLQPSTLLQPVAESFDTFTAVLDDIDGAAIIEPISTLLNELKANVANFNLTDEVDNLLAAVETVKQDLREINPSDLLDPLVADFDRLEEALDRFRPSIVFQPAAELATPLLQFLDNIQQEVIDALFEMFQGPLQLLDRLQPEVLTQSLQEQIDLVLAALNTIDLPAQYNQLKGQYFDLNLAVEAQGSKAKVALVGFLDPDQQIGDIVTTYTDLVSTLEGLKQNVQLLALDSLYTELRERLLAMLPPYARELLDPETFQRVMRLADPTRFLEQLDERFEALIDKLLPIRPQDLAAELDATYETVLALVDNLDIEDSFNQVQEIFSQIQTIVDSIRIDFVAADIETALTDFRSLVDALNPATLFVDLDALHQQVGLVVESTLPSQVLAGLQDLLDQVIGLLDNVDPRLVLLPPLNAAWDSVQGVLDEIDFTIILSPLVDKLSDLELEFEASLRRTETAFDQMLGAARGALGGSVSGSVSVGVTV